LLTAALIAVAASAGAVAAQPAPVVVAHHDDASCLDAIAAAERRHHLPAGLLLSVALAESGRRDPASGLLTPWPWTLNANGSGRFYDSMAEAVHDVGRLLAQGNGLVDVGCMQVDLFHHPRAFKTLQAAFQPSTNVDYAAGYLAELRQSHASWSEAVAAYHAGVPEDGADYLARVLFFWHGNNAVAAAGTRRGSVIVETSPPPFELASQFFVKRDFASALAIYQASLANKPDDPVALLGAAECLRQQARLEEARSLLERALTVDPANKLAVDDLLQLIDAQPPEFRLPHLMSAHRVAPSAPAIPAHIATIEAGLGHLPEAAAAMGEAVRLAPDDALLRLNQALLLDRAGDAPAAVEAYAAFFARYRGDGPALTVPLQAVEQRYAFLRRGTQ
jgi:tetratricopeptide (TPR) repeat protein